MIRDGDYSEDNSSMCNLRQPQIMIIMMMMVMIRISCDGDGDYSEKDQGSELVD